MGASAIGSIGFCNLCRVVPHPDAPYSPLAVFRRLFQFLTIFVIPVCLLLHGIYQRKLKRRPLGRRQARQALLAGDGLEDDGVDLDDRTVERIAQRVAAIMRAERDAPPVCSTEATTKC